MNIIRRLIELREEMSKPEFDRVLVSLSHTKRTAAIRELQEIEAISRYLLERLKIK